MTWRQTEESKTNLANDDDVSGEYDREGESLEMSQPQTFTHVPLPLILTHTPVSPLSLSAERSLPECEIFENIV